MRLPTLRRTRSVEPGAFSGIARLDRRTKRLVGRLRPGDIAIIDHVDIDRIAADSLVAVGVAAVLNARREPRLVPEHERALRRMRSQVGTQEPLLR